MKYAVYPFLALAGLMGLVLLAWLLFFAGRIGPGNVSEQWRFAYDFDASLRAISRQVCAADLAVEAAETTEEREQRRSQALAFQQNYERVKAQYDARLRDAFRAGLIRPPDVPDQAPSLGQMRLEECP